MPRSLPTSAELALAFVSKRERDKLGPIGKLFLERSAS
jgi:hypothetical protein